MTFAVGSLVRARGREWVVLPESEADLLVLRPLGGTDDEVAGILPSIEEVQPATLRPPSPEDLGDFRSGRLLREAVRLGFRNSAGPFRSFGHLACEPRPYQLVPLLMALRMDPVRILIADDVGIGKTIEAALIARELLDRGEVKRLAVLCPPQLAEQWQRALRFKFNLEAELVLPSTARRLEQPCGLNQSLFDLNPIVIVSMDFVKTDRRREEFLRACPELVIVDEAHTCAAMEGSGARHQRHQLLHGLTANPDRHCILVTATPHSGKEEAFRSLLTLLDRTFADLPEELTGREHEPQRRRLAAHFVQRRRADIEHYLQTDTPFPTREEAEETYKLHLDYGKLFDRAIQYARELVRDAEGGTFRQRVRWWSVLALLRSLASSPAAAMETLRNRTGGLDAGSPQEADEIGRRMILDPIDDTAAEGTDVAPGGDAGLESAEDQHNRRQLLEMARMAEHLQGAKDAKLQKAKTLVLGLLKDGFNPIVFCRFIPTAEYVAEALRAVVPKATQVDAVTGLLPPAEREERLLALGRAERRALVCTDCLSEGIDLQTMFDAVVHYDLSWNPTRHEQREGRVDRYGQPRKVVRVLTYYGVDNQIDGVVLHVLLRKHKTIRTALGISVPVPADTEAVLTAIMHGSLLKGSANQLALNFMQAEQTDLHTLWDASADREKRSRTMFAQHAMKMEEVAPELEAVRRALGSSLDVEWFVRGVLTGYGGRIRDSDPPTIVLDEVPAAVRDAMREQRDLTELKVRFSLPVQDEEVYLHRTHPIVEGLAEHVTDTALEATLAAKALARRAGVIRTRAVARRTTVLLLRHRFHLLTKSRADQKELLAEDWQLVAFCGAPGSAEWLPEADAEKLINLPRTDENVPSDVARTVLERVINDLPVLAPTLATFARQRGDVLLDAHRRVRLATRTTGVTQQIEPKPVDVLGVYVYLPGE